MRLALCLGFIATLAACTAAPIVYAPSDKIGDPPSGSVTPLKKILVQGNAPLRLVFVHGVGDHCYGYALNGKTGWLNDDVAAHIGLTPTSAFSAPHTINVSVFMGGQPDKRSVMQYGTRSFELKLDGVDKPMPVQAIEITWSPLTQWLKTNQLAYDSPSVFADTALMAAGCVAPPDYNQIPPIKYPPDRLWLNRTIKEQVFDRALADAIIYEGSYGATIERGVADTLCHAVTGQPDDVKCVWPSVQAAANVNQYVFVTHSLGSRLVYDTFLNLTGYYTKAKENPFTREEVANAKPFVSQMLVNTPSIYMMANQLALLGLANVPKDARSQDGSRPFLLPGVWFKALDAGAAASAGPSTSPAALVNFTNESSALADARRQAETLVGKPVPALKLIAFNDTNDLLTWHIPSWYQNSGPLPVAGDARPEVELVNVFVQNAAHWFIVESPAPAHSDYFVNQDVWKIMSCGAEHGALAACPY